MDATPQDETDEEPLEPAAMAALMHAERRAATRRELRAVGLIVATWGVVWLVGYLAIWSGERVGGNPWFRLPGPAVGWVFGGLMAGGAVVSTLAGISLGRGRRGPSNRAGALFGVSFAIGSVAVWLFDLGMQRAGLTPDQLILLYPGSFTLLIAALYMAGAAVTRSSAQYIVGVVLLGVVVTATFVGAPHHLLVYAAAGFVFLGTAFLVWTGRDGG